MKYITAFLLLFLSFITVAQDDALKIGYVNMRHLINSSPQFNKANQIIVDEFQEQQEEVLGLGERFEAKLEKFKTEKSLLSEVDIQIQLQELKTDEKTLQDKVKALKETLEIRKTEELGMVQDAVNAAIKTIAEAHKFDLILYQEVAHISKKANITALIKEQLRKTFE